MKEIDRNDKGKSGIYKITNLINNKVYIGQSIDLWTRINEGYLQKLPKNKGHNKYLQRAWNKYGKENFKFEVIEYVNIADLNDKETFWISKYKSCNNKHGYNMIPQGGSNRGQIKSEESKLKQSKAVSGSKNGMYGMKHTKEAKRRMAEAREVTIVQLDLKGNFIREWDSVKKAADNYNIARAPITDVLRKKTYTSVGFIWVYKDQYDSGEFDIENHFKNDIKKPVVQLDKEKRFINEYISISEAKRQTSTFNISTACKNNKMAGNYYWMFKEDYDKLN